MKKTLPVLFTAMFTAMMIAGCKQDEKQLVSPTYVDSFMTHWAPPALVADNQKERLFWSGRIDPAHPGYVNESRYAGTLNMAFRLSGEIDSLCKADSLLEAIDAHSMHKESSALLALVSHRITEHRFMEADSLLRMAKRLGLRPYESSSTSFDVDFELGRYFQARADLNNLRNPFDFGYYFRKSKIDHLEGRLDSSIADMNKAAVIAARTPFLRGVALSNAGDLAVHGEDLAKARDAYRQCLSLNATDMHSLMGLGWIALVHDRNDSLAERIFEFARQHTGLPDPLFKLSQAAGAVHDSLRAAKYACEFVAGATKPVYGRMYNKYLLQLFTGILHEPARAETIARDELNNRATPQTYAWYAYALYANGKKDQAYKTFEQYVSGQPLEALELYWMGRMMEGLNKNYNARSFFEAASKTRFDLDPADADRIEDRLNQ